MAGGGNRSHDAPIKIGSTNGFAVLESLKKKKKSEKGSSKRSDVKEEAPVFWNPKSLVSKSWADVEDEDEDDYYLTTAPPAAVWGAEDERKKAAEVEDVAIEEESESEDDLDEGDDIEEEAEPEPEAPLPAELVEKKPPPTASVPKDTERQLSKKELKKKELQELDAVLAELGISGKDNNAGREQSKEGKKAADEQNGVVGKKEGAALAQPEGKTSKKKKSKKDKSSKEVKDSQEEHANGEGLNDKDNENDASTTVDVKEKLKKVVSIKKKKSSKEMDAAAKAAAVEAAARSARLAAAKKKEKNHYNQQPVR